MKYINNIIEDSLFSRMKNGVRKAGLVALVGTMMGVGVYGCKKEPQKEDTSPKQSFEQKLAEELLLKYTKIAFISLRDGNPEIYVMNADGGEQKNLSHNPAGALVPVWSPDGKKIAFERNGEIYVMNTDGSEQKNLTNNPAREQYPSWSPDGKKIAFISTKLTERLYTSEIYVMNADGQDIKRVKSDITGFVSGFPSWSPDGKRIAFVSNVSKIDRNSEIYVMNADGSEQKNLTNNPAYDDHPFWSPDGKKIAFISLRDGNAAQMTPDQRREIYVMNADGSEQKNLTKSSGCDAGLSWSPDGKKIAFYSRRDGNIEIYVMNADGSEQKRLTKDPAEDVLPSWSPDGKKIVFRSKRDGNYEIYVMNADGSEQKNLTNNPAHDEAPSWSPFMPSVAKEELQKEDTPPIESIVQEPPPKADGGAKTTVKLLDPGAQPRTVLRYKFQANRTETMVMEMSMAMTMEIGDRKRPETQVPATRMTMTIDSKEVSPEGDLHYEFELEQVEVLPKPGANPAMVNAMKQQMSRMQGLSGSATLTSRGFTKDVEIKLPPGIDPQFRQSMDQMKQSMNQMSAPLPEEPVGRGARWQVTMPVETPAMKVTQIATYTLSEIQGDKVKFDITIKQSAPPQEIDTPGAAPGVKVSLESLKSSGKATVELQMTNLVPTSNINMTTTNVVSANNQKIKTTMRTEIKIHPFAEVKAPPAVKFVVPKEKTVASARQGRKAAVDLLARRVSGKYVFEGGIVGEEPQKEAGSFVFAADGTIAYFPSGKRRVGTSFTWKIKNGCVQIYEDGEVLFSDGRVEEGNIVFDKFGTIGRFIREDGEGRPTLEEPQITSQRKESGGIESISAEEITWVKCNNPNCKAEYEMGLKEYHQTIEERLEPMSMTAPPLICKECGEPNVFRAEKCQNSDCGLVFFRGSVPNDYADRCPDCGISATEEIRKRRAAGRPLRPRASQGFAEGFAGSGFAGDLLILTCRDFQDKKPVDVTDVFEPTDKRVYVYIKFTNVPSNTRYQVDVTWRDPDDDVYWNYDITIRQHAEAGRYYWYYKWKRIKGDRAADLPGKWTVELRIQTYVNGEHTATNHERANFFMRPKATLLQFADMTKVTGLAGETGGECVAVGDYDGDGDADLYTGNLYRNNGDGTFTDATDAAGMQGFADAISATSGDVDGDDDLDLLVINTRAMALYQNNGDGIFTDMTSEAGIQSAVGAREVILADYDGDGAPDIYIAGVGANRLYHNNSNGTFQDVTEEASVGDAGWSEAAAFGDYDGDDRPDLYVANWGGANVLYRNNGNGTFTDVTQTAGVGHDGSAKAAAWLDYDADGVLDLFVVNSYEQPDVLYRNNGNSTFTDVTETAGLDGKTWGEAFAFSDYGGDGDIDIYLVTSRGADVFYANNGDGTFAGNGIVGENADAAFFDMDSGGGLDLYVVQKDGQNVLYRSFRTYDEAVTAYQKIVEADPEDVAAHEHLARAYRRKGDLEKAIAGYEEIAKLRPDDVGAFETLGDMCEKQGDSGKAIAYYKEAIELAPNDSDLCEKLGDVYRDIGMLDEALAEYDASQAEPRTEIEQGSTNSCVYNKLAWFYVDKEIRPEEMLSLAKKAVELAPDTFKRSHLNVHLGTLGWAYFRNGQLDEALKTFFQVLSTDLDSQSGQSSWEGVSEIAQSAVKPEIFLWFYNEMTTALGESGENMVLQARLHSAMAQFYEHREEREKAQKEWVKTGFARDADWLVLGPFGNTGGADSSNVYLPEQSIDVRATYQGKDRKISWTAAKDELADAYVDLYEMFDESEWSVAFALAQANSPEQREAQLRVGSSGDVKVWINGQEVLSQNTSRSAAIDQDIIPVSLKNGANEILVKVCSHSDDWGFYLRITDMEGTPYDDLNYTPATDLYDHEP